MILFLLIHLLCASSYNLLFVSVCLCSLFILRFVTRMIPMQATCFASAQEIHTTATALLRRMLLPTTTTTTTTTKSFAISIKKRLCSNVTSNEIIDMIAAILLEQIPDCKVNLSNPDVTIQVEICRTLAGISIIRNLKDFCNFSLVTARELSSSLSSSSTSKL